MIEFTFEEMVRLAYIAGYDTIVADKEIVLILEDGDENQIKLFKDRSVDGLDTWRPDVDNNHFISVISRAKCNTDLTFGYNHGVNYRVYTFPIKHPFPGTTTEGFYKAKVLKKILEEHDGPKPDSIPNSLDKVEDREKTPLYKEMVREGSFRKDLEKIINIHSMEGRTNTPDHILADYLMDCLSAYNNIHDRKILHEDKK